MEMQIDLNIFKKTFAVKTEDNRHTISGNNAGTLFKLFPFDSHPGSAAVIRHLHNVVGEFFRKIQKERIPKVQFEEVLPAIKEKIHFEPKEAEAIFDALVKSKFFDQDQHFKPTNISTYKFIACNTKEKKIAAYLYDTLCAGADMQYLVEQAVINGKYDVLTDLVITHMASMAQMMENDKPYKPIVKTIQQVFYEDFSFLLQDENFASEYMIDFLEHYYFFYTSQACMFLSQFFLADRQNEINPLYYSIDWEKTVQTRPCYTDGWLKLKKYLPKLFSHAVTLEILNQNENEDKLDYLDIRDILRNHPEKDNDYARQIMEAAEFYRACIHDCPALKEIALRETETKTEQAIRYLFDSVFTQFVNTGRHRANDSYTEKFELFCKNRFLKNRKTSGYMLNLTDRDLLFLTKLCSKGRRMPLHDLFKEMKRRGIYLDYQSILIVKDYFERLNFIEKKSDSGDAQYVKAIL